MTSEGARHRLNVMNLPGVGSGPGRCNTNFGITMNETAGSMAAIHAAKNAHRWGLFAAMRYAIKRGSTFAQFNIAERFEDRRAIRRRIGADFAGYLA